MGPYRKLASRDPLGELEASFVGPAIVDRGSHASRVLGCILEGIATLVLAPALVDFPEQTPHVIRRGVEVREHGLRVDLGSGRVRDLCWEDVVAVGPSWRWLQTSDGVLDLPDEVARWLDEASTSSPGGYSHVDETSNDRTSGVASWAMLVSTMRTSR